MKKRHVFILFFLLFFAIYSFAQQRKPHPVKFEKISDNLYEILGGQGSRGGAYIGDNGVLGLDTGRTIHNFHILLKHSTT